MVELDHVVLSHVRIGRIQESAIANAQPVDHVAGCVDALEQDQLVNLVVLEPQVLDRDLDVVLAGD